jgi:DNA-directed RNA polymerase sigma subunit (sigma70/sigma32)
MALGSQTGACPFIQEALVDPKTRTETTTQVKTLTRADVRQAIQAGRLTEEQERYVRVRFGLSEPREAPLARRGTAFPATRAAIALLEAEILAQQAPAPSASNPVKDRIVARLKQI